MTEKLTEAQREMLEGLADEWIAHALSTERADRPATEAAFATLNPQPVVWVASPLAGARLITKQRPPQDIYLPIQNLPRIIREETGIRTRISSATDPLYRAVYISLGERIGYEHGHRSFVYGPSVLYWLDAALSLEVELDPLIYALNKLTSYLDIARNAGLWWWNNDTHFVVSDRPTSIKFDRNGLLHNETGPAIEYSDGWGVYCWHGREVPESLIMDGWHLYRIYAEENVEIRRCAIERMGWEQFVHESRLKQVGSAQPDPGNSGQELALYDVPEELFGSNHNILLVTNGSTERDGTRRRYGLMVPGWIRDATEAAAWTYGIDRKMYAQLEVRR